MERSSINFQSSSSNRKFQATFASPNGYFTENSRWMPLIYSLKMKNGVFKGRWLQCIRQAYRAAGVRFFVFHHQTNKRTTKVLYHFGSNSLCSACLSILCLSIVWCLKITQLTCNYLHKVICTKKTWNSLNINYSITVNLQLLAIPQYCFVWGNSH